jgi:hypothetical protein
MQSPTNRLTLESIAVELNSRINKLDKQGNPAYYLKVQLAAIKAQIPAAANLDWMIHEAIKKVKKQKSLEKQWAAYRVEIFRFNKLLEAEKAEKKRIQNLEKR